MFDFRCGFIVFMIIFSAIPISGVYSQSNFQSVDICFRQDSDLLIGSYKNNSFSLSEIDKWIKENEGVILTGGGHIMLVSTLPASQRNNSLSINSAAIRASVVRSYIKSRFRMLTNWNFGFYFVDDDTRPNSVIVSYIPEQLSACIPNDIFYTLDKENVVSANKILDKYNGFPYLFLNESDFEYYTKKTSTDSSCLLGGDVNIVEHQPRILDQYYDKLQIAIHYRWDNSKIDSLYLDNLNQLHLLDSILTDFNSQYIDTLTIVAYSSPEGDPLYNLRLSERRANTMREYIIRNYPNVSPDLIFIDARGENWDGVLNFAKNDLNLPSRDMVLEILNADISYKERQQRLVKLDKGTTYYRYILPNYYKYLRSSASILISYTPIKDIEEQVQIKDIEKQEIIEKQEEEVSEILEPIYDTICDTIKRYPIALRTNLLFDMVGVFNLGLELPIGNRFSVIGDFAYGYWRSANNLYALQTIEWGLEGRYWFNVSENRKTKNTEWLKPLRGWNIGVYGVYCMRYDVQWIDGYQGDGFWSVGLTAGYATPIARNLSIEFSVGAGYFYTPEYRHYHRPEYNAAGDYHLMWQETGSLGAFSITKARISLVLLLGKKEKKK